MKTKLLATLAVVFYFSLNGFAQENIINVESGCLGHGYRAFVDVETLFDDAGIDMLDIQTTHGYQFNPHLFAGAGLGLVAVMGGKGTIFHADVRYDILNGKHTPFIDFRIGNDHSVVLHPTIGYRYKHFNLGAGYVYRKYENYKMFSIRLGWDFGGK